jgi:hypothetical protein
MRSTLLLVLSAVLLAVTPAVSQADPVLAGHPGLAGQTLDADAVKAVLLGKRITLGDSRVVIVFAKTSEGQEAFLKSSVGMTTSQFQNHWRRLFMTGGGSAPKIVETEADAVKLVAETAGAVAIIDRGSAGTLPLLVAN